jgi:hypothetical protein
MPGFGFDDDEFEDEDDGFPDLDPSMAIEAEWCEVIEGPSRLIEGQRVGVSCAEV